jgi:hypothetical protein
MDNDGGSRKAKRGQRARKSGTLMRARLWKLCWAGQPKKTIFLEGKKDG